MTNKPLDVIKMGNPVLRKVAEPVLVETIDELPFQQQLDRMIHTMRLHKGVGIAAPQVGMLQRVFMLEVHENTRYPNTKLFPLQIAINPRIEVLNTTTIASWEGCLSIPNIRGRLQRHSHIKLTALDRFGNSYSIELKGFPAIIVQHELDHLNGVLFIDRMETMETLTFQKEYEDFWMV